MMLRPCQGLGLVGQGCHRPGHVGHVLRVEDVHLSHSCLAQCSEKRPVRKLKGRVSPGEDGKMLWVELIQPWRGFFCDRHQQAFLLELKFCQSPDHIRNALRCKGLDTLGDELGHMMKQIPGMGNICAIIWRHTLNEAPTNALENL